MSERAKAAALATRTNREPRLAGIRARQRNILERLRFPQGLPTVITHSGTKPQPHTRPHPSLRQKRGHSQVLWAARWAHAAKRHTAWTQPDAYEGIQDRSCKAAESDSKPARWTQQPTPPSGARHLGSESQQAMRLHFLGLRARQNGTLCPEPLNFCKAMKSSTHAKLEVSKLNW